MAHTSWLRHGLPAAIVTACLCAPVLATGASAQELTRQQRELLQAMLTAVDSAAAQPETPDLAWQSHIMRASEGSHYVAFSMEPPAAAALPAGPALLYVRLATATPAGVTRVAERSSVREWLGGQRADPRMLPNRGIAIGEMPMMGAAGLNTLRPPTTTGGNELRIMALERERARQEQEARERQRRAELEGRAASKSDVFPFEDFDLASRSARADGTRIVSRAFTAGPGDYDLFLAWADPSASKPAATIKVVRKSLSLEPARTVGLITSSIILADSVTVRTAPYPPTEQASHPYSIGLMDIAPARTNRYGRENNLSVAFQVINAQADDAGMPDLAVTFRIVRLTGEREAQVATLNPQTYNATTLPADFNLRLGHPIFAAVTAPLSTLARGSYRLKIQVNDRLNNASVTSDADFLIVGTPASLLAEAPPVGSPFNRDAVLSAPVLSSVLDALTPPSPSPQLSRAFATARTGKLVDLLTEEPVPAAEEGVRSALRGIALMAVGDASAAVQFQRAQLMGAPMATSRFLSGAARAMQSRDADAIAAWQEALKAGAPAALVVPHLLDALIRRSDYQRAATLLSQHPPPPGWSRSSVAILIATGKEADAVPLIEARLTASPEDTDAQWLLLHALFAQQVRSPNAALRERFTAHARRYIDGKGTHAALAEEWLAQMK